MGVKDEWCLDCTYPSISGLPWCWEELEAVVWAASPFSGDGAVPIGKRSGGKGPRGSGITAKTIGGDYRGVKSIHELLKEPSGGYQRVSGGQYGRYSGYTLSATRGRNRGATRTGMEIG